MKARIGFAARPATALTKLSKSRQPRASDIRITMYAISAKKTAASTIPVQSRTELRLKYSKISRPEANPAPMTSPIYTNAVSNVVFNVLPPHTSYHI